MAYAFKQSSDVPAQVRAIALEQVDDALGVIERGGNFDETVHAVRRNCKKVRGLLRLVRPCCDDYAAENQAIRAVAEGLSVARDAAVMIDSFDALVGFGGERVAGDAATAVQSLRLKLAARETHLRRQMGEDELLHTARERLEAVRKRIKTWTLDERGFDVLAPGLEKAYAKFRKGLAKIKKQPSDTAVHEWRKAAKYHWYHVRLLKPAAPLVLGPLAEGLDRLGDALGEHNNFAVLGDWIRTATLGDEQTGDLLLALADGRKADLLAEALTMGRQFSVERPSAMTARFEYYWDLLVRER